MMMMLMGMVSAATITASVDRTQLNAGESVQLTLNVQGSPDDDPDFGPLQKDFDILSRNQSSNMQIINGSISSQKLWSLTLMPKREGQITIPSIAFGTDHSNAVTIHVSPAQTSRAGNVASDIFLQVKVEPKQAYVQAQILYTVKVYIATNVNNASLTEPKLSDADAVIKKLGKDQRFDTNYLGRAYQVVERRYAIFPQQSGRLRISPVTFDGQVIQSPGFGMNIFQQFGQTKRLRSEAVDIDVKPIPPGQQASRWLPATRIQLQDAWSQDPSKFHVGDAITRTVTLTAEGLTAAQLPKIIRSTPAGFKVYPDQAGLEDNNADSGITGVRVEKMAMIASRPGHYVIPAITLHWWNTRTHKAETATIPQRKIEVLPAIASSDNTATTPPVAQNAPQANSTAAPAQDSTAIANVKIDNKTQPGFWPWLSAFLALGWLVTLVVLILVQLRNKKQPKNHNPVKAKAEKQETLKYIEKNLELTCEQGDPQDVKTALLKWAAARFPEQTITSLSDLAEKLGEPASSQIKALNQVLYSPSAANWKGKILWEAIQNVSKQQPGKQVEEESLAPLYP